MAEWDESLDNRRVSVSNVIITPSGLAAIARTRTVFVVLVVLVVVVSIVVVASSVVSNEGVLDAGRGRLGRLLRAARREGGIRRRGTGVRVRLVRLRSTSRSGA